MLKLTYTNDHANLQFLPTSLEEWINTRIKFYMRSGNPIFIIPETTSLLVSNDSSYLNHFIEIIDDKIIELVKIDEESTEVILQGVWVTSNLESDEGIFVTEMNERAEFFLSEVFLEDQKNMSFNS
jgi:hypothetical protein